MLSLTMMKGLPGSGKSTFAKKKVLDAAPGTLVRVNKDDLRDMLHDGKWGPKNEKRVLQARDAMVRVFLSTGVSVIVDDTNLNPVHERALRAQAERYDAAFKVEDFTVVLLNTCIANDLKREKSVGETVIRDMYNKYLAPPAAVPPAWDPDLPEAILVDIDGTLMRMTNRGPYEWSKVGQDEPIEDIVYLVNLLWETGALQPVFISGRKDVCRSETRDSLAKHVGSWTTRQPLLMRPSSDNREDSIVKRMLFDTEVAGHYNARFVLDDRNQVVSMWREDLGLTCLQTAPGAF